METKPSCQKHVVVGHIVSQSQEEINTDAQLSSSFYPLFIQSGKQVSEIVSPTFRLSISSLAEFSMPRNLHIYQKVYFHSDYKLSQFDNKEQYEDTPSENHSKVLLR